MRISSSVAACLLLAACSGPTLYQPGPSSRQIDALYTYGAAERDLKLEVQGNGFPGQMSGAAFAMRVESGVQGPVFRAPTHPTLTPNDSARSGYRLVFLFNPSPLMMGQSLCDGHADQVAAVPGEVKAVAAFCVSGRAETEIAAQTQAAGPDDPAFGQMLNLMMQALFRPDEKTGSGNSHGRDVRL